jgi:hypothetical protein
MGSDLYFVFCNGKVLPSGDKKEKEKEKLRSSDHDELSRLVMTVCKSSRVVTV